MTQLISDHAALCFIGCLPISWGNFTTCVLSSIWFTPLRLILSLGANVCNIIACTQAACRQNSSAGYILTHPMWSSWFAKALAALQPVFLSATSAFHDVFFPLLSRHNFCKDTCLFFSFSMQKGSYWWRIIKAITEFSGSLLLLSHNWKFKERVV